MAVHVGGDLGRMLATAMARAQGDESEAVALELRRTLGELAGGPSHERAATLYVLAIAELVAGAFDRAVRTATHASRAGEDLGEPGWVANAVAVRAVALDRLGRADEAIDDLVHAEWETRRTADPGLRAWAHAGLGTAYEELRLFELAAPHYEACSAAGADPLDLVSSELIDELNLATLHGTWARELEMLGESGHRRRSEIQRLRALATTHADGALRQPADESTEHLRLRVRLVRAQNAWHEEPAAWIQELVGLRRDLAARDDDELAVECTATLAAVLAEGERFEEAGEEAQRAVDGLGVDVAGTDLDRYVRWIQLSVDQARGQTAAVSGLAFGATVARAWWSDRDNKLEMMRSAISGWSRYRLTEGDRQAAREDPLTGLGNRRAYDEWLDSEPTGPETLLVLDVDRLKVVNDTFGHHAGDELLVTVARILLDHTREPDLAMRLGGDEFVLVVRSATGEDGESVAARVRAAVTGLAHDLARPHLADLSASIGQASTHEGLARDQLLRVADERMYEVKRRQRETLRRRDLLPAPSA